MRAVKILSSAVLVGVFVFWAGCAAPEKSKTIAGEGTGQGDTPPSQQTVRRASFTTQNNPTSLAGRGEPSLNDFFRPATWIYVDGQEGSFIERDGNPQVQWVVEGPTRASPTFRVEAYESLLGDPKDFACTLDTVESVDGSTLAYAIKADGGTFQVGRDYSLLSPGANFTLRNRMTGDVVTEVAPLAPGVYLLAAAVKNLETGKEGAAITYFTVGEGGNP